MQQVHQTLDDVVHLENMFYPKHINLDLCMEIEDETCYKEENFGGIWNMEMAMHNILKTRSQSLNVES